MIKPGRYFLLIAFAILPHLIVLPIDVSALVVGLFLWTALFCFRNALRPSVWVLRSVTLGSVVYCFLRFGSLANPEAATSVLCMITVLKLFETHSYRDAMALLIVSFIVVMSYLIESYSLIASTYMLVSFVVAIYFMMELQRKKYFLKQNIVRWSDLFSVELMVALPLLVALFVFFPRFTTRWGSGERQVQTVGFSERIELGQMANLTQSNEIAFKMRFLKASAIPQTELYFRGAVLTQPQNMSWRKSSVSASFFMTPDNDANPDYQVLLPPREQRNLFTLPNAVFIKSNPRLFLLHKPTENIYFTSSPIEQNISYTVITVKPDKFSFTKEELLVPEKIKPQIQNLARSLSAPTDSEKIQNILNYFKNNQFVYSTETPGYKSIAEFFEQKVGFCEHYASAFALLARELEIPSRVVVGFMGGELNPYDDTITVRDKFAHAWTEVYLKDQGWILVDPTSVIYPQRMANLLATSGGGPQFYGNVFAQSLLFLESINNQFEMFLIGYNSDSQWNLLSRLSSYLGWNLIVVTVALPLFFILLVSLLWWVWRRDWQESDPLTNAYKLLLKKTARKGLPKTISEGPLEYSDRLKTQSAIPKSYIELIENYAALRFSNSGNRKQVENLYRQIRNLR